MKRSIFIAAALALAVTLPAVQAQALAPRTFVSAAGTDNSTCSFAAPCRHFQAAVDATSAGGEVDALDPAGYGPIIISQAITIEGQGWSYAAPAVNSPAITINAVSGNVFIHGVSLNGVGITGNTFGIKFNSGNSLTVQDCVIRNFTQDGIAFVPTTASSQISVSNTLVSDNSLSGIDVAPTVSGTTKGVLDHVRMQNNLTDGLTVTTTSGPEFVKITVTESVSSGNLNDGVNLSAGGSHVTVIVRNSTIENNGANGLEVQNGGGIIVTRSTISGNGTALTTTGSGEVVSYVDNNFGHNDNNSGAPTPFGPGLQ